MILQELRTYGRLDKGAGAGPIADLGCGIGAGMAWFARHTGRPVVGITLSPVQAAIARRRFGRSIAPIVGSFLSKKDLAQLTPAQSIGDAYMVESFTHAENAQEVFLVLSDVLQHHGLLVICDDFPSERDYPRSTHKALTDARLHAEFRWGWHINNRLTVNEVTAAAQRTGWRLEAKTDLSDLVLQNRPRDLVARAAAPVARRLGLEGPYWRNVRGGGALQRLLRRRRLRYMLLVFRRRP